jgi:hypothetical protein
VNEIGHAPFPPPLIQEIRQLRKEEKKEAQTSPHLSIQRFVDERINE